MTVKSRISTRYSGPAEPLYLHSSPEMLAAYEAGIAEVLRWARAELYSYEAIQQLEEKFGSKPAPIRKRLR